jgi:hypothetical protein
MKKNQPVITPCPSRQKRLALKIAKRKKALKEKWLKTQQKDRQKRNLVYQLHQTILHFFPNLFDLLNDVEDCRERSTYSITEILMAGLALFLFKKGSRNAINNLREESQFKKNYHRLFKCRLPHLDTVDKVMRALPEEMLEELKHKLVQILLQKKVLHNQRLFNKYFIIAVDGTGVFTFDEDTTGQCTHKTSKNGKTNYFHNVLEAKLVTASGFSISIMTEWIENPEGEYNKQDCELKAFARLAERLKKAYPRLPICIAADSLYPCQNFFKICTENDWAYIATFKEGSIPTVAATAELMDQTKQNRLQNNFIKGETQIAQIYRWVDNIKYHEHQMNWLECVETQQDKEGTKITRFVHLTNLAINAHNIIIVSHGGRLRWKIENEGFNSQKNSGFALCHKYNRVSYLAMKNYYQCLQIAHLFTQLMILDSRFQKILKSKISCQCLWEWMIGFLRFSKVCVKTLQQWNVQPIQIRFAT